MTQHHRNRPSNSFEQVMLGLEPGEGSADLFSQACVQEYLEHDPSQFGYLFAQVFEPEVLAEVALLSGVDERAAATLQHCPTLRMSDLAERVRLAADLAPVERLSLAASLISISRFDAAEEVLRSVPDADARLDFELGMLEFVVSNRRDEGASSQGAFRRMQRAIESGSLPPERVMDACAQAVVWYLKRKEVTEEQYEWFLERGTRLAEDPAGVEPAALSSWYRGVAMVPAASKQTAETRRLMERAREAAEETIALRPRAYERHLIKTYHESSLKEHMFLRRDEAAAEEAAKALIEVDPVWSPSYGELAESRAFFGRVDEAAEAWLQAADLGAPYEGHHRLRAAQALARTEQAERALEQYLLLLDLAPEHGQVLTEAARLAEVLDHPRRGELDERSSRATALAESERA